MSDILNDDLIDKLEAELTSTDRTFGKGDLLDGRFKVGKMLGRGNFGFTYLVQDSTDKTLYALKTIYSRLTPDNAVKQALAKNIETLAKVDHPNLGRVFHHGIHEDIFYYTMEYIKAPTLFDALKSNVPKAAKSGAGIPRAQLDKIVSGIENGVSASGLYHFDLNPKNVFMTKGGAKVMDVGILPALRPAMNPKDFSLLQMAEYMAPEVLDPKADADERADVFSLGQLFYYMLTLRVPRRKFGKFSIIGDDPGYYSQLIQASLGPANRRFASVHDAVDFYQGREDALPPEPEPDTEGETEYIPVEENKELTKDLNVDESFVEEDIFDKAPEIDVDDIEVFGAEASLDDSYEEVPDKLERPEPAYETEEAVVEPELPEPEEPEIETEPAIEPMEEVPGLEEAEEPDELEIEEPVSELPEAEEELPEPEIEVEEPEPELPEPGPEREEPEIEFSELEEALPEPEVELPEGEEDLPELEPEIELPEPEEELPEPEPEIEEPEIELPEPEEELPEPESELPAEEEYDRLPDFEGTTLVGEEEPEAEAEDVSSEPSIVADMQPDAEIKVETPSEIPWREEPAPLEPKADLETESPKEVAEEEAIPEVEPDIPEVEPEKDSTLVEAETEAPWSEFAEDEAEKEFFQVEEAQEEIAPEVEPVPEPMAEEAPKPKVEPKELAPAEKPQKPAPLPKKPPYLIIGILVLLFVIIVAVVVATFMGYLFAPSPIDDSVPTPPETPAPETPTPPPSVIDPAEKLEQLVAKANQYYKDQKWATPENENAIDVYHEILKLEAKHPQAIARLAQLEKNYIKQGSKAYNAADYNKSYIMYGRALRADPNSAKAKQGRSKALAKMQETKQTPPPTPEPTPAPTPTPPPEIKSTPTPAPTPKPPAATPPPGGGLSKSQIKSTIQANWGKVKVCIGWGKQANPNMTGKCVVKFVIQPSGKVSSASVASSSLGDSKTEQCLVNRVLSMKFPAFSGSPVTINFPFVVSK